MNIWIEKTLVNGFAHKTDGDRAMGKVLWSPRTGKDGRNTYKNMKLVLPGDLVLHFIDNSKISGISEVENEAIETEGLEGTPWNKPSYLIKLKNYKELNPPVERGNLLNEKNKNILNRISETSEVFYNNNMNLRQGGYLSPCPIELLTLINNIYKEQSKVNLPFIDEMGIANTFRPDKIKRPHVIKALKAIDRGEISLIPSTKFDILFEGETYPPKDVLRLAHKYANGEHLWEITGGEPTNKYLKALGFLIVDKGFDLKKALQPYISGYKELIVGSKDYDELYKWEAVATFQKNWDLSASDLPAMIERAFPGNNNLWVSNNYYPIGMLKEFAEINSGQVVAALKNLFNESDDLENRILTYKNSIGELFQEWKKIRQEVNKNDYQDARTIGLLLAFNAPSKHFLFKYGILKSFCKKFGLSYPERGDIVNQILMNEEISGLVRQILMEDKELLKIHEDRLTDTCFKGDNYNLLTQDFIYSIVTYQKLLDTIESHPESIPSQNIHNMDNPTNTIFYGPPGTGKTYALKSNYVPLYTAKETSLSKEKNFEKVIRDCSWWQVIAVALVKKGKSKVAAISEHPWVQQKLKLSNVENLRPILWSQLQSHTVEQCSTVNVKRKLSPLIFNKSEDSFWEIIEAEIENQAPEIYDLIETVDSFVPNPDKEIKRYSFVTFHQSFSYEDFIEGIKPVLAEEGEEVSDIGYEIQEGVFKELCTKATNDPENRYAIFIDEINRGNVSQIFGELITLIEYDKRKGALNEMDAILPYSKKSFTVPSNLDIYGTMNTADRSVEALDTALRRRFSFVEMNPDPTLLESIKVGAINLNEVLQTINDRIELLVDRDHTIGHAYLMNVNNPKDLSQAFSDKIIPLLQEYFYGDYGKIGLVLGKGFIEKVENNNMKFARFKYESQNDFKTPTFVLKPINEDTILPAIEELLGTKDEIGDL